MQVVRHLLEDNLQCSSYYYILIIIVLILSSCSRVVFSSVFPLLCRHHTELFIFCLLSDIVQRRRVNFTKLN